MKLFLGGFNFDLKLDTIQLSEDGLFSRITQSFYQIYRSNFPIFTVTFSDIAFITREHSIISKNFSKCGDLRYRDTNRTLTIQYSKFYLYCNWHDNKATVYLMNSEKDFESNAFKAIKYLFFCLVIKNGGLPIHSSALSFDNNGFVFTGKSSSGKSTIASLLETDMELFNDEVNVIIPSNSKWHVYSTPFQSAGTPFKPCMRYASLTTIFLLQKHIRTQIKPVSFREAFTSLISGIYAPPLSEYYSNCILNTVEMISKTLPIAKLYFNKYVSPFSHIVSFKKDCNYDQNQYFVGNKKN